MKRCLVVCTVLLMGIFLAVQGFSATFDITGEWDSVIIAHFKDRTDLNRFIKKILAMEHIERTNTQVALNIVKDEKRILN